jgi:hypothetical protein
MNMGELLGGIFCKKPLVSRYGIFERGEIRVVSTKNHMLFRDKQGRQSVSLYVAQKLLTSIYFEPSSPSKDFSSEDKVISEKKISPLIKINIKGLKSHKISLPRKRIKVQIEPERNKWWHYRINKSFDFFIEQGLKPHHYFLDIGCGTLRSVMRIIDYLQPGHYFGFDKEITCFTDRDVGATAIQNLEIYNLRRKKPVLWCTPDFDMSSVGNIKFDFMFAQSVFNHMSDETLALCLYSLIPYLKGKWFATYLPSQGWQNTYSIKHRLRENEYGAARRPLLWYQKQIELCNGTVKDLGVWEPGPLEWYQKKIEYLKNSKNVNIWDERLKRWLIEKIVKWETQMAEGYYTGLTPAIEESQRKIEEYQESFIRDLNKWTEERLRQEGLGGTNTTVMMIKPKK